MSRVCELTGKRVFTGNNVSHANNKTRKRWLPNLKQKKYFVPELSQSMSLTLSTRAIRTIDKQGGITSALLKAKPESLSVRLQKVCNRLRKGHQRTSARSNPNKKAPAQASASQ